MNAPAQDPRPAPHEEEWNTGDGALSGALYSGDTWIGSFTDPKRARLARAAPRMADLLLDLLNNYECGDAVDARIGAILKAAGVLP